jgi:MSHA biogenesis protein MshL
MIKNTKKSGLTGRCALIFLALLIGCQSVPPQPELVTQALDQAIDEMRVKKAPKPLTQLPNAVQQELFQQNMQQAKQNLLAEHRYNIAADQLEIKDFLAGIVKDSALSIALHPDVSGKVTLNLKDVTLDEVLTVVEQLYGYDIRRQGKIIQVYPSGMRTETIPVNYLYVSRSGSSSTNVSSGGVVEGEQGGSGSSGSNNSGSNNSGGNNSGGNNSGGNNSGGNNSQGNGTSIQTNYQSDFWPELEAALRVLVGTDDGRSVVVSPLAGLVTVRAMSHEINVVKKFLKDTETHLRRQVIIEAKILEVSLNDDFQQGVKWDRVLGHAQSTDLTLSTTGNIVGNAISGLIGGAPSLVFDNADFAGVIELLSTQGNVQVLSSPRITATNNQKAVIKVGQDEYFVTGVSSNTTATGSTTTVAPEVDLTPFFSGIALDVTPQIDAHGEVILHVHPSVTVIDEQIKVIRLTDGDYSLPLAQSSIRESDTVIRAKSGEIVVIGGLIETRKQDRESKTPLLGDVPLLGNLFKSKSQSTQKKELVILLKPVVIGQETWKNQLKDARALLKQWFPDKN